jgi:hypothetical protein
MRIEEAGIMKASKSCERLERMTRKWWLYLLILASYFLVPPYSSAAGFVIDEGAGEVVAEVLIQSLKPYKPFMPVLHIIVTSLIAAVLVYGNRVGKFFSAFVGINYLLIAFLQNTAIIGKYGLGILTVNITWFFIIGLLWLRDVKVRETDYTFHRQPWWKYWVIPLAVLAFWSPDRPWDFDPIYLLTSDSPLAFCLMTPIYLSMFYLLHPRVNLPALRVTSFIGALIGIFNMGIGFIIGGSEGLYHGFIHVPLLTLSLSCFILSAKEDERKHIISASNHIYRSRRSFLRSRLPLSPRPGRSRRPPNRGPLSAF